ncbi:hypothetical protein [Okeania sp.]|uniref:hypothetical protein n=1 Tax=Okeania sp. TaxID=3100323 RepID=UPI002B4ACC6D|nr:hypothetical protein [Okeania sp.]MEB3342316.1 hypothetical protein [Okeania sp.]
MAKNFTFETIFFENFESNLSRWTGKSGGSFTGFITNDPLHYKMTKLFHLVVLETEEIFIQKTPSRFCLVIVILGYIVYLLIILVWDYQEA